MAEKKTPPIVENPKIPLIAKKDWHILCGEWDPIRKKMEFDIQIKKGENLSGFPKWVLDTLKSEAVI